MNSFLLNKTSIAHKRTIIFTAVNKVGNLAIVASKVYLQVQRWGSESIIRNDKRMVIIGRKIKKGFEFDKLYIYIFWK